LKFQLPKWTLVSPYLGHEPKAKVVTKRLEQDWEVLPYHEESKEKESCNDIGIKTTKVNK
jgi:hypothetical protein